MNVEIRVPNFGEVNGIFISKWLKETGDIVEKDEVIAEIDTDKAYITLNSPESGRLEILTDHVYVENGQLLARLDTAFKPDKKRVNNISPNDIVGRK
jgi:2-oxoglutarate dehydrogenase E2 component (dihydrolipoamide succinyltransferase)